MAEKKTEVKLKSEKAEKAIARLFSQMGKEVNKRMWTSATYSALICYLAEECGVKWNSPESRKAFRELMTDSDFSFSSNFKKYAQARGFLPASTEYEQAALE